MKRHLFLGAASAVQVTVVVLPTTSTATATTADDAPVALTGEVLSPALDTVKLTVAVWPNQETLDALPVDARVPLLDVDHVEVSENSYTVHLDPASLPDTHVSDTGVNLEVSAQNAAGEVDSYNETLIPTADGWQRSAVAADLLTQVNLPLQDIPGFITFGGETGDDPVSVNPLAPATEVEYQASSAMEPVCGVWKTNNVHHRAKISDVMPAVNMTGRVTYRAESSHELGVVVKGMDGKVNAGGTITRKTGNTTVGQDLGYDHTAKTTWRYQDYKNGCTQNVQARPHQHQGGNYTPTRSRPKYTHCLPYNAQEWRSKDVDAYTYTVGVTIWGVDAHTQVGYDQETEVVYKFDRTRYLCGSNANPEQARLVAGYASNQ